MREWIELFESEKKLFELDNVADNPDYEHEGDKIMQMYRQTDSFTKAYVEAMFFTEAHADNPELEHANIQDLALETMNKIIDDCKKFQEKCNEADINIYSEDILNHSTGEYASEEMAGHDFWLTRNGNGAGFWDGRWKEPYADKLDKISKAFGEINVYLGDDGLIYMS